MVTSLLSHHIQPDVVVRGSRDASSSSRAATAGDALGSRYPPSTDWNLLDVNVTGPVQQQQQKQQRQQDGRRASTSDDDIDDFALQSIFTTRLLIQSV